MLINPYHGQMNDMMIYNVIVEVRGEQFARLGFTNKTIAQNEYNRIKASGIYGGAWITKIEFIEDQPQQAALLTPKPKKTKTVDE